MMRTDRRSRAGFATLMVAALLLTGCSHLAGMRWPWAHKPQSAPEPVSELVITSAGGAIAAYPQYWKRNTLVVDLHDAAQEGGLVLKPRSGTQWPVRLALRVTPGSIGVLEIRGEQRMLLPVAQEGRQPVDLELAPGVYTATTVELTVHWSAR